MTIPPQTSPFDKENDARLSRGSQRNQNIHEVGEEKSVNWPNGGWRKKPQSFEWIPPHMHNIEAAIGSIFWSTDDDTLYFKKDASTYFSLIPT